MPQYLTTISGILKDKYQPALANLINVEPSPFMEMIRKEPLTNNKVRAAAPIGMNGGFGFGSEGVSTPSAGEQRFVDFEVSAVDMYVDIRISNKTVKLGSSNQSSMINALDAEVKGSYAAAKWNLARSLFGDGTGKLATCTTVAGSNNSVALNTTAAVMEGLTIDVYAINQSGTASIFASGKRIKAINHATKVITIDAMSSPLPATGGFITVQGSYNKEITGLGAIFSDTATTIYGVSRADNPWLCPQVIDLDGEMTDMALYRGIRRAKKMRGAKIDLIMMGDEAFETYQAYMDNHTTHVVDRHKFVGGSTGYSILVGDQEVIIVNESLVPSQEAWAVDTKSFILQQTPWEFVAEQGNVFQLMNGTSVYRALLAAYGNLICTNPGGCVRFTGCVPEEEPEAETTDGN